MFAFSDFTLYIGIGIAFFVVGYFIMLYNHLVTLKNNVKKAWANIDVLLKQRHDELPKLIATCQQYMQYEKTTLEKITALRAEAIKARQQHDIPKMGKLEGQLRANLGSLFALAENYPALKADTHFSHLQQRSSALENSIADRRELYNESATLNNTRIEQFPDLIVAKLFSFQSFEPLVFSQGELTDIDINAHFTN